MTGQDLLADLGLLQRSITVQCSESSLTAGECLRSTPFDHSSPGSEWLIVAASRRSGDEVHPWPPNGDLRPFADDGPGKTSGRLLVLHCGMMLSDVDQQLGKLKFYH